MVKIHHLIACLIFSGTCFAGGHLAEIPFETNDKIEDETFRLKSSITKKYTTAAKFLAMSVHNVIETYLVTYETTDYGVYCHVAWYVDGCIGTALDGTEAGKQVVIINDSVVGISYHIEMKHDHFIHHYTWGAVYSYPNRQAVVFY